MEGPLEPGQTVDLGAALAGDYYIEFTPEPTGNIDTDTGEEDVTDLTGPYDLLLMGTRFSTTAP
jgi:predicted ABC-type transport system involved in lysophospholipase L1 biosynthesis ATPase subunit